MLHSTPRIYNTSSKGDSYSLEHDIGEDSKGQIYQTHGIGGLEGRVCIELPLGKIGGRSRRKNTPVNPNGHGGAPVGFRKALADVNEWWKKLALHTL